MDADLIALQQKFKNEILAVKSVDELERMKGAYLGKKSAIKSALQKLGGMAPDQRKSFAEQVNGLATEIEQEIENTRMKVMDIELRPKIDSEWADLGLPGKINKVGARHPLTILEDYCIDFMGKIGFEPVDGPEVDSPFYNFDALNIPEHHPARDMQDTFWLENNLLLRSHTTTVQARTLEHRRGELPIKIVSPGRVYRNEDIDATHLACFHQFEGLWVGRGVKVTHLKGVLGYIVSNLFDEKEWIVRYKPKFYPYTEPSIGVDVAPRSNPDKFITILGSGMVHPNVFRELGYDPNIVSGFAFGLGISRIVSQIHQVKNMKSLYEQDLRVHQAVARKETETISMEMEI